MRKHPNTQHRCSYSWEILHHLVPDSSSSRLSCLADSTHVVCLDQCRNTVHVRICLSGLLSDYICHMELVGASVITFHRNVGMCTRIDVRTCVGWNFLDQMPGYCKYHEICQIKCQYILQTHEICQIKRDSWCQEICPNICRICMYSMYVYIYMCVCACQFAYVWTCIYIYAHVRLHIRGYVKCASGQMWEYMERQRSELCVGIYVIISGYVRVSMFVRMFILRAGIQITIGGSYCRVHLATPT